MNPDPERRPIPIEVALGLAQTSLPPIESGREIFLNPEPPPPELVQGVLHEGCKMILTGTSKSNKSWCLLDLALSVSTGRPWWGFPTTMARTLFINFELPRWSFQKRVESLVGARSELADFYHNFHPWHLRGYARDFRELRRILNRELAVKDFGLIILDPAYKLLGDRDENANGDITDLMNEFEGLAQSTGAAVVLAHHFAKGDPSVKDPMDRMSGAGVWARDPDSILVMTPHEEPNCFAVHTILRNLPMIEPFVLEWEFPLMQRVNHMDPDSIRRRKGKKKAMSDSRFISECLTSEGQSLQSIVANAQKLHIGSATVQRYLQRLSAAGVIGHEYGTYWAKERSSG
jgi:hypothetical protein